MALPRHIVLHDSEPPTTSAYHHDVLRVQQALAEYGFDVTYLQSRKLWELYSDRCCHGWANLNGLSDAAIYDRVRGFFSLQATP